MRHFTCSMIVWGIIILTPISIFAFYVEKDSEPQYNNVIRRIIVKLKESETDNSNKLNKQFTKSPSALFEQENKRLEISKVAKLFSSNQASDSKNPLRNIYIIEVPDNQQTSQVLEHYQNLDIIEYAHPDWQAQLYETPNDPYYSIQWSLHNTGQQHPEILRHDGDFNDELIYVSGIADADIDAQEVFDTTITDFDTVIVAIIDTGIDPTHAELSGRIWQNNREIPDNFIDDDNNGYIDDTWGWDFCGDTIISAIIADNDPTDPHGHGTHCAGIVASLSSNAEGIVGINRVCKIMSLKFYPYMLASFGAEAIVYATDNGADVISMSWGYPWQVSLLDDAVNYAKSRGVILCAASGNDGTELYNYPASIPNVITVGATTSSDLITSFSTYSSQIDLVAPGMSILSLRAANTDIYAKNQEPNIHIFENNYYLASGTSMACPHVSAIAAFLRGISAGIKPEEVYAILTQSADDIIDPYGQGQNMPGWDIFSGYGRVNLWNCIGETPNRSAIITFPVNHQILSGEIAIRGTADGEDFTNYTLEAGIGIQPDQWTIFTNSMTPVSQGNLGTWITSGLNGNFLIRLAVDETNTTYRSVFIANEPRAEFLSPNDGDTILSLVEISGSAFTPGFTKYELTYRKIDSGEDNILLTTSSKPVFENELVAWNTSELTEGEYEIILNVFTSEDIVISDTITLINQTLFSLSENWKAQLDTTATISPNYGDFNGDGINEIIVGTANGILFFDLEGNQIDIGGINFPGADTRVPIAVGRLDNDNIDDFVAILYNDSYTVLYGWRSNLGFFAEFVEQLDGDPGYFGNSADIPVLALKDIDSDSIDEILYSPRGTYIKKHYLFDSDGTLILETDNNAEAFLSVDLDNNGLDELYVTSFYISEFDLNGNLKATIDLGINTFEARGLSAFDIDNDCKYELILFGTHKSSDSNYVIYAFDENLQLKAGWPHTLPITNFLVLSTPLFADIDNDGNMECITTCYELVQGQVYVWRMDGRPYFPSMPDGLFAVTPNPSIVWNPILSDINSDGFIDIIAYADVDMFNTYPIQRLVAWDYYSQILTNWPIITTSSTDYEGRIGRITPTIGDLDNDGYLEIITTTSKNELEYISLDDALFSEDTSPVNSWRINRRRNNIAKLSSQCIHTDVTDQIAENIPENFALYQNYPNPFNSSTIIKYDLKKSANVNLKIVNTLGQTIKFYNFSKQSAGEHQVVWNGKTETGLGVSSGVYLYEININNQIYVKKMLLLK